MGFIQMPDLGINPQLVQKPRSAHTEHNILSDAPQRIVVVKPVGDRPRELVIFINIGSQEKHWNGPENIAGEVQRLHPHLVTVHRHREADPCILQEAVWLFAELHRQLSILTAHLIVITIGPQQPDSRQILLQLSRRAHVGAGKEAEAAGVNLETLVNGELAREIDGAFREFRVDLIAMGEGCWQE